MVKSCEFFFSEPCLPLKFVRNDRVYCSLRAVSYWFLNLLPSYRLLFTLHRQHRLHRRCLLLGQRCFYTTVINRVRKLGIFCHIQDLRGVPPGIFVLIYELKILSKLLFLHPYYKNRLCHVFFIKRTTTLQSL